MPESAATAHSTTSVHRGVGSIPEVVRTKRGSPRLLRRRPRARLVAGRSEEHTSELQSRSDLVCRLLLEKKKRRHKTPAHANTKHHCTQCHPNTAGRRRTPDISTRSTGSSQALNLRSRGRIYTGLQASLR